jgi:uncharacterized membrane protein
MEQESVKNTTAGERGTTAGNTGTGDTATTTTTRTTSTAVNSARTGGQGGGSESGSRTDYASSKRGIIGLGAYLVLMTVMTVIFLAALMMAEDPPLTKVKDDTGAETDKEQICCGTECRDVVVVKPTPSASPTPSPSPNNTNAAANTTNSATNGGNVNTGNTAGINTNVNATPTNVNTVNKNVNTNQNVNTNTNAKANSNGNTNTTKAVAKQDFPEITVPAYLCIDAFRITFLSADGYLFFIVLFAGMLGALIRGTASFFKHLGLGDFSFKWTWFYILLPLSGATLSLVIYFVIRGGFYGGSFGKGLVLNVFAFAAFAMLTGLFSEHAMEKLRQVAVTLLSDVPSKVPDSKDIEDRKKKAKKKEEEEE